LVTSLTGARGHLTPLFSVIVTHILTLTLNLCVGGTFVIISREIVLQAKAKQVASLVDGKGGGRGTRFQGRAGNLSALSRERVLECLSAVVE
jgi:hypothetical protein